MKKALLVSVTLGLMAAQAPAASGARIMKCTGMPNGTFSILEIYDASGDKMEVVSKVDGEDTQHTLAQQNLGVEARIQLPKIRGTRYYLENRHTGWTLTQYANGNTSHAAIDCN